MKIAMVQYEIAAKAAPSRGIKATMGRCVHAADDSLSSAVRQFEEHLESKNGAAAIHQTPRILEKSGGIIPMKLGIGV